MTDLWTIIQWIFYGGLRWVMFWAPLIEPSPVRIEPPSRWWASNTWSDWYMHLDDDYRPDEHWLQRWFIMVIEEFRSRILYEADWAIVDAKNLLRGLIGTIRSGYGSACAWLRAVEDRAGDWLPPWASNLVSGLVKAWEALPFDVREGWLTWSQLWESIKESVRSWARDRFDAAKAWASDAWNWVLSTGSTIRSWYDAAHAWLDALRADPYGRVAGWLGTAWSWLVGFAAGPTTWLFGVLGSTWSDLKRFREGPLVFYYELWSAGWRVLADLVADPKGFIYALLENAVLDRW